MKIIIVTNWFLWPDGSKLATGGVETYILNLIELFKKNNFDLVILQYGHSQFEKYFNDIKIISWKNFSEQTKLLKSNLIKNKTLVCYSGFSVMGNFIPTPSIVIQHGIGWDIYFVRFKYRLLQRFLNVKKMLDKLMYSYDLLKKIQKVSKVITVDTNFQNWMRAMVNWYNFEEKFIYIPNFAEPAKEDLIDKKLNKKYIESIIFARRFEDFRGVFLFANVVKDLASNYPNIDFIFCGRGGINCKNEEKLRNILDNIKNVKIYERPYIEMHKEHYAADIAVIPSYGSEGTSFSLIEAMAAGCAVIATTIGGLGNIIIPEYNGLIIQATEVDLKRAIIRLIENPSFVRDLGRRAYNVVRVALNKERWERQILTLISQLLDYSYE